MAEVSASPVVTFSMETIGESKKVSNLLDLYRGPVNSGMLLSSQYYLGRA